MPAAWKNPSQAKTRHATSVLFQKAHTYVKRYKPLIRRGVILTVGFAFDVNAGMKPDAPPWMQRLGLTWIFRLCSEPRRLGPRYLRYNFLFIRYLLLDGLRGRAWGKEAAITATRQ